MNLLKLLITPLQLLCTTHKMKLLPVHTSCILHNTVLDTGALAALHIITFVLLTFTLKALNSLLSVHLMNICGRSLLLSLLLHTPFMSSYMRELLLVSYSICSVWDDFIFVCVFLVLHPSFRNKKC